LDSRAANPADAFQIEWMAEDDRFAPRTSNHRSYTAACRGKRQLELWYKRRISSLPYLSPSTSRKSAKQELGRKFFDCKSNGMGSPGEASVPKGLMPVLAIPEQFCGNAVIKC
jgi:hypothetical protein